MHFSWISFYSHKAMRPSSYNPSFKVKNYAEGEAFYYFFICKGPAITFIILQKKICEMKLHIVYDQTNKYKDIWFLFFLIFYFLLGPFFSLPPLQNFHLSTLGLHSFPTKSFSDSPPTQAHVTMHSLFLSPIYAVCIPFSFKLYNLNSCAFPI